MRLVPLRLNSSVLSSFSVVEKHLEVNAILITIHRSDRVIYALPPHHRLIYRADIWSFESSPYRCCRDDHYADVRTDSIPLRVEAPFGSEVIPAAPRVDWPEFRFQLRVHTARFSDPGLLAEQVYRLACQGARGFRLAVGGCPRPDPETEGDLVTDEEIEATISGGAPEPAAVGPEPVVEQGAADDGHLVELETLWLDLPFVLLGGSRRVAGGRRRR
jgi:hypothetical protein